MSSEPQAAAEPKTELERLREEVANFKTWGIIEIAVRNPNVSEYMTHWEDRATKAEATIATLRAELEGANYKHDYWKRMHDETRAALIAAEASLAEVRKALEKIERNDWFWTAREYVTEKSIIVKGGDNHHSVGVLGDCGKIARAALKGTKP